MHYVAISGGTEHEVEILEVSPYRYRLTIGGRVLEVDARAASPERYSLVIGDEQYAVETQRAEGGQQCVSVRGHSAHVEVLDLRGARQRHAALGHVHDGPRQIKAPMPGKIVTVLVKDGEEVREGQGLLVIEAMKMENELRSPKSGTVRKLVANPGATVEGGAELCVIE